jgi:uncharacterized protein with GYD domain
LSGVAIPHVHAPRESSGAVGPPEMPREATELLTPRSSPSRPAVYGAHLREAGPTPRSETHLARPDVPSDDRDANDISHSGRNPMPMFILSINWTDQGIRNVKDAPKRAQAARDLGNKVGVELKEVYLTSGENDLVAIVDAQTGDNVAKFAMALGSQGNVRTRTARAWTESEFQKLLSELP